MLFCAIANTTSLRSIGVLLIVFLFPVDLHSQISEETGVHKTDSLVQRLNEHDLADEVKVDLHIAIAREIQYSDSANAIYYAQNALDLSKEYQYEEGEIRAIYGLGWIRMIHGQYDYARDLYNEALQKSRAMGFIHGEALAMNGLGMLNWNEGNYPQSLTDFFQSLKLHKKIENKRGIGISNNNIGLVHGSLGNQHQALIYYKKAFEIHEETKNLKMLAITSNNIAGIYESRGEYNEALFYASAAMKVYQTTGTSSRLASAKNYIGWIQYNLGEFDSALVNYTAASEICNGEDNPHLLGLVWNNMGLVYHNQGNYVEALIHHTKAKEVREEQADAFGISMSLNNIGLVYHNLEEYDKALQNYREALKIKRSKSDEEGIGITIANIGLLFNDAGNYDSALYCYREALDLALDRNDQSRVALYLSNLGFVYKNLGQLDEAIAYFRRSIAIYEQLDVKADMTFALLGIGNSLYLRNDLEEAKMYIKQCIERSQEVGLLVNVRDGAEVMALVQKALGNYKEAYQSYYLFKQMEDSLTNKEITKEVAKLEASLVFQARERELNYEHDLEQARSEKALQDQKNLIIAILVLVLFLAIIAFLINRNRIRERKSKVAIESQKAELEKLNQLNTKILGVLSHDLKTPIFALQNTILLFDADRIDEVQLKERTKQLNIKLTDTSFFMNNLLHWAKDQLNELKPKIESSNIRELVDESLRMLRPIALEKGVVLANECLESHMANVDREMMQIVIRNLVANAIKYSKKGDLVELLSDFDDVDLKVMVRDQGTGVDKETLSALFHNGVVKSTKGTNQEVGTGLGLMLSKEFAEKFNGRIEIQSEVNQGSTFIVKVPKSNSHARSYSSNC